ncbi:MAG: hypothetical protein ACRC0L_11775 [Angustibacter sp.]
MTTGRAAGEAQALAGVLDQWWQTHDGCVGCPICGSLAVVRSAGPAQLGRVLRAAAELLTACADLAADSPGPDAPRDPRPGHTVGVPDRRR